MGKKHQTRRDFLGQVAAAGLAGVTGAGLTTASAEKAFAATSVKGIPYRTLGRSEKKVSLIGLGGYHIGIQPTVAESIQIIHAAIDHGINFMDNCWDYNGGESEIRMGKALQNGYRKKVFLMTKTDGQVKDAYEKQLHESLRRLRTEVIDLVQFHEVVRMGDPDRIFGPNGAFEAALAARKAGKIRYIGFTGHKDPAIHLKMLNTGFQHGFTFDTVQMPLNVMDAHDRSFAKEVVPVCVKHGIGVLGMKPLAFGQILQSHTVSAIECLHYAMNLPTSVVINGCDSMERLDQALEAARTFHPMSKTQVAALLKRTAKAAANGGFEPFKTSHQFDGTWQHPQWLG
ncbi:MAG TPA: aldo/keto reductase [Terriglobia bacterium]|nr:aldo/keto reductase [Terriglobia bacterium]